MSKAERWTLSWTGRKVESCLFFWDNIDNGHYLAWLHSGAEAATTKAEFDYRKLVKSTQGRKTLEGHILNEDEGITHWLDFIRQIKSLETASAANELSPPTFAPASDP